MAARFNQFTDQICASIFILMMLVSTPCLPADEPYTPGSTNVLSEEWRWKAFPELANRGVNCFEEDSTGTMWFGVDSGLIKYDGKRWTEYSTTEGIPGVVTGLCDLDEQMFANTRDSLFLYSEGRWKKVFPFSERANWIIEDVSSGSDGSLWIATNWGAVHMEFDRQQNFREQIKKTRLFATRQIVESAEQIFADSRIEMMVVGSSERKKWKAGIGAYVYGPIPNGQNIIAMAPAGPADQAGLKIGDQVISINQKDRPTLFQRDLESESSTRLELEVIRPSKTNPLKISVTTRKVNGVYETFRPYRIVEDNIGRVWFATRLGSIISMEPNPEGETIWIQHTRKHGLKLVAVPSLAVTANGIAAVGRSSNERSLIQFDGIKWKTVELPRLTHSSVIETSDGTLLVGAKGAVISIDKTDIKVHSTMEHGINRNHLIVKQTADNAIWVLGNRSRVLRVEPQSGTFSTFLQLNFCDQDVEGNQWFISKSLKVVRRAGQQWRSFDSRDGLMDVPVDVLATKSGDVWVAGSHHGVAATARLRNGQWELTEHPKLAWMVSRGAVFEDSRGRVWFGGSHGSPAGSDCLGGVVRFDGQRWKHFVPTGGMTIVHDIAETRDGTMWFAGPSLAHILPDDTKGLVTDLPSRARQQCNSICTDQAGDLWIGSMYYGVGRLDGDWATCKPELRKTPVWYNETTGPSANDIKSIVSLPSGSVMVGNYRGFDRFDGEGWYPAMLPDLIAQKKYFVDLRPTDTDVWSSTGTLKGINYKFATTVPLPELEDTLFRSVRYRRPDQQPETTIEISNMTVQEGSDFNIGWAGKDDWNKTPSEKLHYSWRVDNGRWSPFTQATTARIPNLNAGKHQFQVRARNDDFNIDTSPAEVPFEVTAPLVNRTWFQLLLLAFAGLVAMFAFQTARVLRRDASLRAANQKLIEAEQRLRQANSKLEDTVVDRTKELRLSNRWLNESEVRFRSIVQDQSEYILRFDAQYKLEFANDAFLQSRNYDYENSTDPFTHSFKSPGSNFLPRLSSDEEQRLRELVQRLTSVENSGSEIISVNNQRGEVGWEEWQARELFANNVDGSRVSIGFQAIGRDITDLMQARQRLREKEHQLAHLARVSTLGEMVAGISHEIKQPLASIANFSTASKLVLDKSEEDEEDKPNLREWIDCISKQTYRIDKIIKGLRRFGRPGSVRTFFPISEAIHEALLVTASDTRDAVDQIDVDCPLDVPQVFADQVQIEQVLVNLIRNACEAMQPMRDQTRRIKIKARNNGDAMVLTVTDSGQGISPALKNDVFDTFVTDKPDGMGVGLPISRSIVESHGGKITIDNQAACGKITFTLPLETPSVVGK